MGVELPDEGDVSVIFDDLIIQDTVSEKWQDMAEVAAGLLTRDEFRAQWYGDTSASDGDEAGPQRR